MTTPESIWSTTEVNAWMQGLDYASYILYVNRISDKLKPVSEKTYTLLCEAFFNELKESIG